MNPAPPSDGLARLRPRAPPAERLASLRASRRYCAPLALRSVLRYAAEMFVDIQALFERQLTYPNPDARDQLNRLVGLDESVGDPGRQLMRRERHFLQPRRAGLETRLQRGTRIRCDVQVRHDDTGSAARPRHLGAGRNLFPVNQMLSRFGNLKPSPR